MLQEIYAQSLSQVYPIGMRYAKDDRVFRYAKAGSALVSCRGSYPYAIFPESAVAAAGSAIGARTVTCTAQGIVTLNQFKGGYMMHFVTDIHCHRIKGNAAAGPGSTFVVTLEDPLLEVVTSGATRLTLYPGLFNDMRYSSGGYSYGAHIGVPLIDVTINYHFWLQTWGPAICVGTTNVGGNVCEMALSFNIDGSVLPSSNGGIDAGYARAGVFWPASYWDASAHIAQDGMIPILLQCIP